MNLRIWTKDGRNETMKKLIGIWTNKEEKDFGTYKILWRKGERLREAITTNNHWLTPINLN